MIVTNHARHTRYLSIRSGELADITNPWSEREIAEADLEAHLANCPSAIVRPDRYRPVVAGLIPIPGRSSWSWDGLRPTAVPRPTVELFGGCDSKELLLSIARRLSRFASGQPIAVEMSGGLDTALVVGALQRVGIAPMLVGFVSERFEFRTERAVQEDFFSRFAGSSPIPESAGLPFARLSETPTHAVPSMASLCHAMHEVTAVAAREKGARIVVNGTGFDALLCEDARLHLDGQRAGQLPLGAHPWALFDPWIDEHVYRPRSMHYFCAASIWPLPAILQAMRAGSPADPMKLWARKTFSSWLPRELSEFAYKASHDGWLHDGLAQAADSIHRLLKQVNHVTRRHELDPDAIYAMVRSSPKLGDAGLRRLLSLLSFAVWVHSNLDPRQGRPDSFENRTGEAGNSRAGDASSGIGRGGDSTGRYNRVVRGDGLQWIHRLP